MKQHEQAGLYLQKAAEDEALLDEVMESTRISDEIFGFHCQQAAEKILKALLSFLGVRFRKTHDLRELIDLLTDHGVDIPEAINKIDDLTPFAVEFRYDLLPIEPESQLDRQVARQRIRDLRCWVEQIIK
jgi:HEPN domain-containing protein